MKYTDSIPRPPVTQLRPLHSYQSSSHQEVKASSAGVQHQKEEGSELLRWHSLLEPRPNKETAIKAFVKLVSRIIVLAAGEAYCIEDAERNGFILACAGSQENESVTFVEYTGSHDDEIPTDFSIGEAPGKRKTLQLNINQATRQVSLTAQAIAIPAVALEALGSMLDDILLRLQQGRELQSTWTKPSVMNVPPHSRPLGSLDGETKNEGDSSILLHQWFEQRVAEYPQRVALDFLTSLEDGERIQYTYQQVENAANAVAAELVRRSVQPRPNSDPDSQLSVKTVAVSMGPCPELYISYLATLKAGMAFCPIPVDAPEERKRSLMADLKPVAVMVATSTSLESSLPRSIIESSVSVTPYLTKCDKISEKQPSTLTTENDVAYILYTSGTTGMPKGVAVSHISAACTISSLSKHYNFTSPTSTSSSREPTRWFQGASPTFDISIFEIFWTLSTGSTLCCAPREFTMQDVNRVVKTLKADITNITPSFASLLDPSSIQGLMVGGETLNAKLLQDFASQNPMADQSAVDKVHEHKPRGIYNGYGPTETAIYCIAQAHVPENQRGSVLGTPLATCGIFIIDDQDQTPSTSPLTSLEPVPMGAIGELVITGPQVSKLGYINRPDETARAFIDDARWGRVYKTGDRARIVWDHHGKPAVEFLGRISDEQVKLSGRRVELTEIESVLASKVQGVRETLSCIWKQDNAGSGSEKIVSLVVLDPRTGLGLEEVRRMCMKTAQQHLPDYMRPFRILQIEALPRSASGKVDRKAASAYVKEIMKNELQLLLSEPSHDRTTTEPVEPLSDPEDEELERELLSIVSSIISDDSVADMKSNITATTPLAEAGMDSLRAMRLLQDIRKRWLGSEPAGNQQQQRKHLQPSLALLLAPEATVRSVFFPSSVSDVIDSKAAKARSQLHDFSSRHISEALERLQLTSKADIEMVLPATSTQSQLAMSLAIDRRNYITHSVFQLKADVSPAALKAAVEQVVSQQAIYRSAMLPCDDSLSPFAQVVLKSEAWSKSRKAATRIVQRKASASQVAGDLKRWLNFAEENIDLESQNLYHIQVIDSESESESKGSGLLVVSVAHCICDGASLEVLMSDIAREYAGLEPLPRQSIYETVLEWASNLEPETDNLWRESLKGWEAEPLGSLSGNNIKSSAAGVTDFEHNMVQYTSGLQWQALETKSRALGASPLSIIQASWSILLDIFSEADMGDVTFGSVISGHHLSAHAPTFSVVPCRVALPRNQTIKDLVDSLTSQSRFAQSHRHTSCGIFKTLPYNTALALQAYVPSEDPHPTEGSNEITPVPWTGVRNPAIRYDLAMFAEVFPSDPHSPDRNAQLDNMTFKLTYRDDNLSELSAACIVKQLASLVEIILQSSPDDSVQGLPALLPKSLLSAQGTVPGQAEEGNEGEYRQIQGRDELLHSQFESQATSTPDLLAVSFYNSLDEPPTELSYAELDSRANGLANILREIDVEIIPICMQRSIDLYVAILAILKAGSAWCPIDETSPVLRRTSLIARTQSKVLLTTTESLHLVQPCLSSESLDGMRVILIDEYSNHKTSERPAPRRGVSSSHQLGGQDLAYLLWTSGTTGEPKGVMMPHTAAAEAMRDLQIQVEHDPKTDQVRTLQFSAYSFDVFVQDLFYTWGLAGSIISGTRELMLSRFVEFIWASRPTHAHLTPSFGASIAVEEIKGSTLQYVTFIGEKLTEDVAEAWAAPEITTRAYNTYGPAENAVVSTMRRFYGKSRDPAKAANVGFPLTPCTAYVVREVETSSDKKQWELVPRYGVGELALGGAQVAKGYLNNEVKTTKAFIQGGHGIDERIYLTGDVVRLNDHGFEFLGRNDDLVKVTGIRIELSEISAACASVKDKEPAIEHVETLHLQRPGADVNTNNKLIVTFVSVKSGDVDTGKIRAQVFQRAKEVLPVYMVPAHIVVLETTMPRTASNKVDRKALENIYKERDLNSLADGDGSKQSTSSGQPNQPQWNQEQLPVLQIIAGQFKVPMEPLCSGDSLAGLGLSSLHVTKLAWSLRKELNCPVGVRDLMRCQFLGELVDVVLQIVQHSNGVASPETLAEKSWVCSAKELLTKKLHGDMRPKDTTVVLPVTPMQESLVVETMLEHKAYWAHRVFDLSHMGRIDLSRLREAWTQTAVKFDILRTIFVSLAQLDIDRSEGHESTISWARQQGIRSTIVQLVREEPVLKWTTLSPTAEQGLAKWAEKIQTELRPTTTSQPPWAVTIAEKDCKMMLSIHHALYDAVLSEIILGTVAKLYQKQGGNDGFVPVQLEQGMELGLLPSPSQRDEAASSWNNYLADIRKSSGALNASFPDLTQSRQKQPQKILCSRKAIPASFLTSALGSPALPILLQSAFGCILASYMELKAVMFGQNVSQRILHPDLARVLGPAMTTMPVVVRTDAMSAQELWKTMTQNSSRLFRSAHNLHPVDIKKMLNEGSGNSNAPFPGVFVFHPASERSERAQDQLIQQMFQEVEQALSLNVEHPLAFNIFEGEAAMELTGDGRRISQYQLDLMLDQIIDQARVMLESPQLPLSQLTNKMSHNLIARSGEAATGELWTRDPTEKVTLHASKHPEWIAAEEVIFDDTDEDEGGIITKTITYAQLNRLTNAIASKLVSHEAGLQTDDVVAMCLSRDIKSLAATLAIFRAGYVYLPIDDDLPSARKQLLISDAKPKLIITTEEFAKSLELDLDDSSPVLLLPDGANDVEKMLSWPVSPIQPAKGHGGYLLYTSGSTGRPKGVRVSNQSLCHFVVSFSSRIIEFSPITARLGPAGKYLNLTSRSFDPHLTQLFVPWALGHRVVIGKDRTAMLGNLQQVINDLEITHFGSVPSVLTQLRLQPEDVPSVKVVTTGGEKASGELLDTWSAKSGTADQQAVLFNFYGPTEVTIGCLGHAVNHNSNARNLGLPLQGLEAFLLCPSTGDDQVLARKGQPGELCIAGPQVALGYLERPVENAKSFHTTSLLGHGEKRFYKTGDMMRMMHDGSLEFLGRLDQQAKIRGQRLELDEVVSFLKKVATDEGDLDFAAAVVTNNDDESNRGQQLFGFLARKASNLLKCEIDADVELLQNQGHALTSLQHKLEKTCESELPAFMVPTMLWVSRIPYLAASGKVDTKLLAKLANDFFASQKGREEDSSNTSEFFSRTLDSKESAIVMAVEEAIGGKVNASSTSTIHNLGIDSLSAVYLVSILKKRGFPRLTMADVLSSSSTVGSLSRMSDEDSNHGFSTTSTFAPTSPQMHAVDRPLTVADLGSIPTSLSVQQVEAVLPCLPLQAALIAQSLLTLSNHSDANDHLAAVNVPYVAQFDYILSSGTDIARWKKAVELVVSSEAMLKTCFVQREEDGQIFQVVLQSSPCSPFEGHEKSIDMVAKMNEIPPIRTQLRKVKESGETIFSLKIHHALFDGVAIEILRNKLEQCYYNQDTISAPINRSINVLTNISDYCHLSDAQIEETRRLWQAKLHGVQPCLVNTGRSNKSGTMARSTSCFAWSASQLTSNLRAESQDSGISISASAAFQLATFLCIAEVTRQTSVSYGFVMSLRPLLNHVDDGVHDFFGPCLTTLIQTLRLDRMNETLPELAKRVHEAHSSITQTKMPLVSVEQVQRWTGSEEKLYDGLLSINVVGADEDINGKNKPGRMSSLGTQSLSDMALAIDVNLHADGKIVLTLSSAGALTETKLKELGQLFEKAVYSCTDNTLTVNSFVPLLFDTKAVDSNGHHTTDGAESEMSPTDESYQSALASVRAILCRLLRLKPSDLPEKNKTTSLYQIGLDSITVLPFVKALNKSEGFKLTPDAIIKSRTIQGAAKLVQDAKTKAHHTSNSNGKVNGITEAVPQSDDKEVGDEVAYAKTLERVANDIMFVATPLQEGMLSASLAIEGKAYTYVHAIQLSEEALMAETPNLDYFFAAVKDTVLACEILRTRFVFTHDDDAPWVGVVSPTDQSDLVHWEVMRSQRGRIHLRIHHALYDATSIRSVLRILGESYNRRVRNQNQDGESAITKHIFRPFARTVALTQSMSVAFWSKLVQDYSYKPLDFSGHLLQASSSFVFKMGEHDLLHLQERCKAANVTTKAALQLAWVKVLCESIYGQSDVVYGETISTGGGFDGDDNVVGPTINTVPMRVSVENRGSVLDITEALTQVQCLNDDARGKNSMASLRKIQTLWRSMSQDQKNIPASLFQSLFVFDGVVDSEEPASDKLASPLFTLTQDETKQEGSNSGPAYDEYPMIVSFHIKNNTLQGKLRAKMTEKEVEKLGAQLEAATRYLSSSDLQKPALDASLMKTTKKRSLAPSGQDVVEEPVHGHLTEDLTLKANAVLELVKTVLGTRYKGKDIGLDTKLVNVGLDSILAIRLSSLLKKRMKLSVSVFEIIKGATIHDIVRSAITDRQAVVQETRPKIVAQEKVLKGVASKALGLQSELVKSVLPVLSGQRAHLEQWLYNGKRFFEAPWVYRVVDDSIDAQKVASCWAELCRVHEALRTTFVCTGTGAELVQVILKECGQSEKRFLAVQDSTKSIPDLINQHVSEGNTKPSDLRYPPARLAFLEASDGKAVVLRVHHALYDAWSIKMIEEDLKELLANGRVSRGRPALDHVIRQIMDIRQPVTEDSYWKNHLSHAQDTVLKLHTDKDYIFSTSNSNSLLGAHFKKIYSDVVPTSAIQSLAQYMGRTSCSAAIILAYANALGHITKCSHPTFGFNYASRSLSSTDGTRTLDFTTASLPTLTLSPISVDLTTQDDSVDLNKNALDLVQNHLAELTKFAQADGLQKLAPRYNSYINILYPGDNAAPNSEHVETTTKALSRYRLEEPLASSYFTTASASPVSTTIEELDTSHLSPHRLFFNVIVHPGRDISVSVSGDSALCGEDYAMVDEFVSYFGAELSKILTSCK